MDKKISAAIVTMLFVLGIVAVPVSAHFTMGNHIGTYPFRTQHFDPHRIGLVGYVFPGGGLFTTLPLGAGAPGWYTGAGTYPGYQSPWPYWTSGVSNPFPTQGPAGWYQLDANNYAPFGAILTSTIKAGTPFTTMWKANKWASDNPTIESLEIEHAVKGDLILAFNVTASMKWRWLTNRPTWYAVNFTVAEIMIPPEFTGIAKNKIVASWTNNYDLISVSTRNREDFGYGPYWRRLRVATDTATFAGWAQDQASYDKADDIPDSWLNQGVDPSVTANGPFEFSPWKTFGNITFTLRPDVNGNYADEWYYIRVNDVTAPTISGAYHFKFRRLYTPDMNPNDPTDWGHGGSIYFPIQNWPVVLVKGEVDPAIITGTIRYGGWENTLYGLPVSLPGRVRAVGIADDPYTGKSTGRPVEARGYFDVAWNGHYEVEGVAPGVYDLYASAAGYPEIKFASNVKILKGQSYHYDAYLIPGVQIRGTVFSKCGTGEVPWQQGFVGPGGIAAAANYRNIKIEIYKSLDDAQSMLPGGTTSKAITWSPTDYGAANWGAWSFPWTVGGFTEAATLRIPGGVGPSTLYQVPAGGSSFDFQFGREGLYGAPADMDGHVPGLNWTASSRNGATWVSGIGPGTYWVRAWLYGYVQTEVDGVTFMPVTFTVPSIEWPGNVYLPFDLRLSSRVRKTVHFHDVPGTLMENPIGWGWSNKAFSGVGGPNYYRFLAGELVASGASNYKNPTGESVYAWEVDDVLVTAPNAWLEIRGFKQLGLWYGYGRNYGIPAGLYTVRAYMWGYVEQVREKVNLGLCGTTTYISDHLYRGANFNITLYSKDWQHPTADKYWSFPYMPIYVQILKDGTFLAPKWDYYVMPISMQGFGNTSVAMWPYMWNNPWHMIKTHQSVAKMILEQGPIPSRENDYLVRGQWGGLPGNYYNDFFGPVPGVGTGAGHFRKYDGSEQYMYYYYWGGGYGEGPTVGTYPFSFESGTYEFKALTYGYVQKKPVMVGATKGNATSDILIKLTQGAELTVTIKFKHEGVFEGLPFDAHLRIRVLDDKNKLVGEYLTSDWWWQPQFEYGALFGMGTNFTRWQWNLYQTVPVPLGAFDANFAWGKPFPNGHRNIWRVNYVPQGTQTVTVVIAGLPDMAWVVPGSCDPCGATGDMSWEDRPIDAPYGIDAYPNYKGGWKVQVHTVPVFDYYPGHYYNPVEVHYVGADAARTVIWPIAAAGPHSYFIAPTAPLGFEAMLTGELYYTADMKPVYVNHVGPYELRYDVIVPGTHLGGESSLIFELDRLGLITGNVFGYTWCDDWRTTSWTSVLFTAADGSVFTEYTRDGRFAAWLKPGPYTASVVYWTPTKGEGYKVQTMPYHVSDGALGGFNVYLEQSQVPIPEFPVAAVMLALSLAASALILRRRRK